MAVVDAAEARLILMDPDADMADTDKSESTSAVCSNQHQLPAVEDKCILRPVTFLPHTVHEDQAV